MPLFPLGVLSAAGALLSIPQFLVVAGGGGAAGGATADRGGGGGGAGGFRTGEFTLLTGTNFSVTVGAGGVGGAPIASASNETSGSNSVFSTFTSAGGGRAGRKQEDSPNFNGVAGGSGGGGTGTFTGEVAPGGAGNTPSVSPSQGNAGGNAPSTSGGGGGGGGSGSGGDGSSAVGNASRGLAGLGATSLITGTPITFATGGRGGAKDLEVDGNNGTANRGEGGEGGSGGTTALIGGGSGGSGVVILRYPGQFTITIGAGLTGTTATSGSEKVTTITNGEGNVSWA